MTSPITNISYEVCPKCGGLFGSARHAIKCLGTGMEKQLTKSDTSFFGRLWRALPFNAANSVASETNASNIQKQMLDTLQSIDKRLATLESTVRPGVAHKDKQPHIVTGHWND